MTAPTKPVAWHLIDRAMKMMQMAGYHVIEHDAESNDPIAAWMADARTYLAMIPDAAAIHSARLEGVRAGIEAAAIESERGPFHASAPTKIAERIRALTPETVSKEKA